MKQKPGFDQDMCARAESALSNGCSTYQKRPERFIKGIYPTHLKKGVGCRVTDTQGNEYIDLIMNDGAALLGYAQEEIVRAVTEQAKRGINLSLSSELEVEAAEKIKAAFPTLEHIAFIPSWDSVFRFISSMWHKGSGYCNFFEPVRFDTSDIHLAGLKKRMDKFKLDGQVVAFNETETALRFPGYSAARYYDLNPDILFFGNALGAGFPLYCIGGPKRLLKLVQPDAGVGVDTLALAACIKQLDLLNSKFKIDTLWDKGEVFKRRFNAIWPEGLELFGYPTRGLLKGNALTIALFMQESCRSGVLVERAINFSFPHIEIMDDILSIFSDILQRIKLGEVTLKGDMPHEPLRDNALRP